MSEHFNESLRGNFREIYAGVMQKLADGARIANVGSWGGASAAFLASEIARSGKQLQLHCVDGSLGTASCAERAAALQALGESLRRGGVAQSAHVIERPAVEAAESFEDKSLDFVMLDVACNFEIVRANVRAWYPKVKSGGAIAGTGANSPGVLIAIRETIPDSEISRCDGEATWLHIKQRARRGDWSLRRASVPSGVFAYIPHVNRLDLLARAISSVRPILPSLVIVDQSVDGIPDGFWQSLPNTYELLGGIFRSPKAMMTFTQMMNWAQCEAAERKAQQLCFMHNDAEVTEPSVIDRALECARRSNDIGVVFTNYDAFCIFNTSMTKQVGPWDETFQWYFSDNDYYRRLRLLGFEAREIGGEGVLHHVSQTLASDAEIRRVVLEGWQWHAAHYAHKWGGPPGSETYRIPYDGNA
ncbi:MAG TPA: class I SAM-dependent methyltransferase [Polyangiaceae bacterium]